MSETSTNTPYEHLIEHIHDAVVRFELVKGAPIVVEVNAAFEERFGYDANAVVGEPLNEWIVPEWLAEEANELDANTRDGQINYQRVTRETTDGLREFLYRGIPTHINEHVPAGFAVYTDLTDISRTERRLQVMNRILRHNLRNQANIILGHTTRLIAEPNASDAPVQAAAQVERAASRLERLSVEAGELASLLSDRHADRAPTDLIPAIHAVVNEHRERFPAADFTIDLPDCVRIRGNGHFRIALTALIENAVLHHHGPDPMVVVYGEHVADGWAEIHVVDDGPLIPKDEREVISGTAEITGTQHASGLGLWLVKWWTERVGGELRFEQSDIGGNSVRLRLPTASDGV